MAKIFYRYVIYTVVTFLIFGLQVMFLSNFGSFGKNFNLILAVVVILIVTADYSRALFFSLLAGLLMDIYSALPFGIFLITFFLLTVLLEFLFLNFFTNHSFYSLISMGLLAVIFYYIALIINFAALYAVNLIASWPREILGWSFLYQTLAILLILGGFFFLANALSKKFKPIFLKS